MSGRELPRVVVMASGNGSNFESIVMASRDGQLDAKVELLIVDRDCYALKRAERLGVEYLKLGKPWKENLREALRKLHPDLIVLAGFMRILPADIVSEWRWRIVNIHPSLLPAFPGKDAIRQAYDYGVKVTGITIHLVDEGVDTGPVVFQKALQVKQNWDLEKLEQEIHRLEHENYPKVINDLLHREWRLEGRKFVWI